MGMISFRKRAQKANVKNSKTKAKDATKTTKKK